MKLSLMLALALATFAFAGCGGGARQAERSAELQPASGSTTASQAAPDGARAGGGGGGGNAQTAVQDVSLQQADASQAQPVPSERKIIRDATLTLEVDEPAKAAERVTSIADSRGGYVVSSESRHVSGGRGGKTYEVFTVQVRVPAAQFDAALKDVRATAGEVTAEKVSGKDVTEEYIDLEARLRTQRALEAQLLDIMKTADEVSDAISVQRELTTVRTDIERIEGRRRFLESQSSLSTISVTLQPPAPLIATNGFFHSVAGALGDGVDIAANITLFLIRALLALLPVFLFIVLPAYFILRYLLRRLSRRTQPPVAASPVVAPPTQSPYDDGPRPAV
ncbi:MAG TPA: DUF4349 domain-containing protein [Pyrinomonadaceae bacterium]|nr:DUF4349 domain-containing protein [Pyrinomonadaceae bacterium]